MFQRGHCVSLIWDQTKQTINLDEAKTAELIICKTEDKQFWFGFVTTRDSHDGICLQRRTVCICHVASVIWTQR